MLFIYPKLTNIPCNIQLECMEGVKMKNKIYKLLENDRNKLIVKISILIILALGTFIYVNVASKKDTIQTNKTTNKTDVNKTSKSAYVPTDEEFKVLQKHYYDLKNNELDIFKNIENKYDSLSSDERSIIKDNVERLRSERETIEENQQIIKDNMNTYSDFIKEIEDNYPSMKVDDISGKDKNKAIDIYMTLLNNLNATYSECNKLTLDKETKMKETGINKITIFINDKNGENQGIISFELKNGQYKQKINTFSN